jgi:membrane protease subunit (stomatin/prohibitin family)
MRLLRAAIAILPATFAPALAFDDNQFCVAARQIAIAAEKDVGIWIDRMTRNAGMSVACEKKVAEFTRFSYVTSAAMTPDWKAARSSEWNAAHCNSLLWREAIDNGWTVVLNIATADGGRAAFKAQCR